MDKDLNDEIKTDLKKISDEINKRHLAYLKTLKYMAADAPIEILCLSKPIENTLISNGYLRIYDLFDKDFTEIKGFGTVRINELTSRLDQFLSMM